MPKRARNLLLVAGLAVAGVVLTASFFSSPKDPGIAEDIPPVAVETAAPEPSIPGATEEMGNEEATEETGNVEERIYAVSLPRLQGLPANAAPGTRLELWVAWEPPITRAPRYQKLLDGVVLSEIVPPPIPEAPPTALLSVASKSVGDLLYADRYGALSALVVP